jgi:hypothetical protein
MGSVLAGRGFAVAIPADSGHNGKRAPSVRGPRSAPDGRPREIESARATIRCPRILARALSRIG